MLRCLIATSLIGSVSMVAGQLPLKDRQNEIQFALKNPPANPGTTIEISVDQPERVSLAIFEKSTNRLLRTLLAGERLQSGTHSIHWDGLDNEGDQLPKGDYEWRSVSVPGLTARYMTTIGINPPGGEDQTPNKSWVGDHLGGGIVDVDSSGIYVGSPATEGGRMILKVSPEKDRVLWSRPQFYQSGRLTKVAAGGQHVFMIHPNGKLRRLNKDNGRVEKEWQAGIDGQAPSDIDLRGKNLALVFQQKGIVRWISTSDGTTVSDINLENARCLAAIEDEENGELFVGTERDVYRVGPKSTLKVATLDGDITAMDFDDERQELWVVINNHQIIRFDENMQVSKVYSEQPRPWGVYDPSRFAGVTDIASDLDGGFFISEPARAPRRIAHVARDGSIRSEWFGGMSFYVNGCFDPEDPTKLIGIAPEGSVNVYKIDYENQTWKIVACYQTGRLGDSIFPFTGAFRIVRRGSTDYLYHRETPAVIRLDAKLRRAVPVAYAGDVRNKGRSFFQFAGTGREGYPKPWVKAAEFHGYEELSKAPKFFSWADTNGNGDFDPQEFQFYPTVKSMPRGGGDYFPNGDYLGRNGLNQPKAFIHISVSRWEGPDKSAPRWALDQQQPKGKIVADSHGFGSVRSLCIAGDGSVSAAYQAGVMIRGHGQYEGGGWPESGVKACRLLKFDSQMQPVFAVGRQSKVGAEANTGVLYYPMKTAVGPNNSVILNDQTKQPAQVWTKDGLFVGGVFDNRADDGLADAFYQIHGDDNQGCTVTTTPEGNTYWLMPYQGHNRLYEITGWNNWTRRSGSIALAGTQTGEIKTVPTIAGEGLNARYSQNGKQILKTIEPPIDYQQFGAERHHGQLQAPYSAEWNGYLVPKMSDRYRFHTLLGKNEQVAIWIDGRLIHANQANAKNKVEKSVDLIAGHRHLVHIQYVNPDKRAELKLMWSSRVIDHQHISPKHFYPKETH